MEFRGTAVPGRPAGLTQSLPATDSYIITEQGTKVPFLLSIIIPVHNQSFHTRRCISSLLTHQPGIPFEIIVVDDGSTDDTVCVVNEFSNGNPHVRLVTNHPPHRFACACNRGTAEATGNLLLFLNNDTEALPNWFPPLLNELSRPEVGIVAPRLIFPNNTIQHMGKVWRYSADNRAMPEHIHYEVPADAPESRMSGSYLTVTGACILLRRTHFQQYGPFDPRYINGWEDDDLCLAFLSHGLRSVVSAESTLIHHQGGTLKAEADCIQRYLNVLKQKGIKLSPDDALVLGLSERTQGNADSLKCAYDANREYFLDKWKGLLSYEMHFGSPSGHTVPSAGSPATIVIVTYNSAATISPCITSVISTLRPDDRLVVVDNASRDNTAMAIRESAKDPRVRLIENRENLGYSTATNQGLALAETPLIVLLNPDTEVTKGWLDRLAAHFDHERVAAIGPVSNFAAVGQSVAMHWKGTLPGNISPDEAARLLYGWNRGKGISTELLIGFCVMLRRDLLAEYGGLDERLFLGNDDLELSWRLRSHGYELKIATDVFVYHEGQHSFNSEPSSVTAELTRQSSDALYAILAESYSPGRVPPPDKIWSIDWFKPSIPKFNPGVNPVDLITDPAACCPTLRRWPLVSIVILTFNQLGCTEECLASIQRHTPLPHEIIMVDNGSTDGTVSWLKELSSRNDHIRVIVNGRNLGFAAGCNQGMAAATGEFIVLLNNDVVVTPEWLTGMLETHKLAPNAGIIGPMTNSASGIQVIPPPDYTAAGGLDRFAADFRARNRHRRIRSRRIVGFCMLFNRRLYEEIGGLDESFGTGNYEDDDFCLRAAIAGYSNYVAGDVYLHHHGSMTFVANNIDYRATLAGNWNIFREKWSRPVTDPALAAKIAACRVSEDANLLIEQGRHSEAIQLLAAACQEHPENSALLAGLVEVMRTEGRAPEALAMIKDKFQVGDDFLMTIAMNCMIDINDYDAAESLATHRLEGKDLSPALLIPLYRIFLHRGWKEAARAVLKKVRHLDPGLPEPYYLLGEMAVADGNEEYAAALFEKCFRLAPEVPAHSSKLASYAPRHDAAGSIDIVKDAVRLYPKNSGLARLLFDTLLRASLPGAALEAAESYLSRFGLDDQIIDSSASLRRSKGRFTRNAPPGQTVSLCMIVRDEEHNLPKALSSLKPLVHEIVIVDTGSSDRTKQVADLFGAQLISTCWSGDFSAARNLSLASAHGDWLLVMDADEQLSPRDYPLFQQVISECHSPTAFAMETRNYTKLTTLENIRWLDGMYPENEAGVGWTPSSKVRLFPNHKGIEFTGTVHELVEPSVTAAGIPISQLPIPVHHYGALDVGRQQRKKSDYFELGKKKLAQASSLDPKALYELAIQAAEVGRFEEAKLLWARFLELQPDFAVAWFNLGYVLLRQGKLRESLDASRRALELNGDYPEAVANILLCEFCLLPAQQALETVKRAFDTDHSGPVTRILQAIALCRLGNSVEGMSILGELAVQGVDCRGFIREVIGLLHDAGYEKDADFLNIIVPGE